jgi:ATP-dependent Clp protease ATP-binding subunit ClpA
MCSIYCLQVLDDGRLDGQQRPHGQLQEYTLIVMTSNIGSDIIQKNFEHVTDKDVVASHRNHQD